MGMRGRLYKVILLSALYTNVVGLIEKLSSHKNLRLDIFQRFEAAWFIPWVGWDTILTFESMLALCVHYQIVLFTPALFPY